MQLPYIEIIESIAPSPDLLLWKFMDGEKEIKNGAQLIVRESQSVILIHKGQIAEVFGPGLYTLSTDNMPVLSALKGWKYGFKSPFKVDIYFLNTHPFLNNKWGTPSPVIMRDLEFGAIRIRAFGSFDIKINNPAEFFSKYSGTYPLLSIQELQQQLRDFIAPNFAEILATENISILDISGNINSLSAKIGPLIAPYFAQMGVELLKFIVTNVTLPDEVQLHLDKMTQMNMTDDLDKFMKFNTAKAVTQQGTSAANGASNAVMMGVMLNQMSNNVPKQEFVSLNEDNITTKLRKLKELYELELIDESEYKIKKSELIEQL